MRGVGMLCLITSAACGTGLGGPSFDGSDYGSSEEPATMRGMVAAHNATRAEAEPTPSPPLAPLIWSSSLAEVAEEHAERCRFEHSDNDLGENLYAESGLDADATTVVASWAAEISFYDYASNSCAPGKQCGH